MLIIKYLATIKYSHTDSYCQSFDTIKEAKEWLDKHNNNYEYTTIISELDKNWEVKDWFYYTEAENN